MKQTKTTCSGNREKRKDEPMVRMTEAQLNKLSLQRLKAYYRSQQEQHARAIPWCCENHCFVIWPSKEDENAHASWHTYIMFVKAILKTRSIEGEGM